eukprot:467735_1
MQPTTTISATAIPTMQPTTTISATALINDIIFDYTSLVETIDGKIIEVGWIKLISCEETAYTVDAINYRSGYTNDNILEMAKFAVSIRLTAPQNNISMIQQLNNAPWGAWSEFVYCNDDEYAIGFKLKVEGDQSGGDDTAANSLRLICASSHNATASEIYTTIEGNWGFWSSDILCPSNYYIIGFDQKVEGDQHGGDDTAMNSIKFKCNDPNNTIIEAWNAAQWGSYTGNFVDCPPGYFVCGFKQQVEGDQSGGDDTALNAIELVCCGQEFNETDYMVTTKVCSNPVYALNNKKEMSYSLNITDGRIAGYQNTDNWIGSQKAKARLNNVCFGGLAGVGSEPHNITDLNFFYQSCGNFEGIHIGETICKWQYSDFIHKNIDMYFGFDMHKNAWCDKAALVSINPTTSPTMSPNTPYPTMLPITEISHDELMKNIAFDYTSLEKSANGDALEIGWVKLISCKETAYNVNATNYRSGYNLDNIVDIAKFALSVRFTAPQNTEIIQQTNNAPWGVWSDFVYCNIDEYVIGFRMRIEGDQSGGDDTAANSLRFVCKSMDNSTASEISTANEGVWGDWSDIILCPPGYYIIGFDQKVEGDQSGGDDTAMNSIKFKCNDPNNTIIEALNAAPRGSYTGNFVDFPPAYFVSGFKQQVEDDQGGGDDTSLNAIELVCCDHTVNQTDYMVTAKICSNPVYALNNGKELSYLLNPMDGKIAGFQDTNNWIGSSKATARLENSCFDGGLGGLGSDAHNISVRHNNSDGLYFYQACDNQQGIHIGQTICKWQYSSFINQNIDIYFGFDVNKRSWCEQTKLATFSPTETPSLLPTTLVPTIQPTTAPTDVELYGFTLNLGSGQSLQIPSRAWVIDITVNETNLICNMYNEYLDIYATTTRSPPKNQYFDVMWIQWNTDQDGIEIGSGNIIGQNKLCEAEYYAADGWRYVDVSYVEFKSHQNFEWTIFDKYENRICYEEDLYSTTINNLASLETWQDDCYQSWYISSNDNDFNFRYFNESQDVTFAHNITYFYDKTDNTEHCVHGAFNGEQYVHRLFRIEEPHYYIDVKLKFWAFGSWNPALEFDNDYGIIYFNGKEIWQGRFMYEYDYVDYNCQGYEGFADWLDVTNKSRDIFNANRFSALNTLDLICSFDIEIEYIDHTRTDEPFLLSIYGHLNQDISNEAWGFSDVEISYRTESLSPTTDTPTNIPTQSPTVPFECDHTVTELFGDKKVQICWVKMLSCTESYLNSNYIFYHSWEDIYNASWNLISVKFSSDGIIQNNDSLDNYSVIAKPNSNPIYALKQGKELSYLLDETDGTIKDYQDIDNWIGNKKAKARLSNACFSDVTDGIGGHPSDIRNVIYHACNDFYGIHIIPETNICLWEWRNILGVDMAVYVGFSLYMTISPTTEPITETATTTDRDTDRDAGKKQKDDQTGIIVGVVIAIVLLLLIIATIIYFKNKRKKYEIAGDMQNQNQNQQEDAGPTEIGTETEMIEINRTTITPNNDQVEAVDKTNEKFED